jgi:hypothetical protein
MNDYAIAKFDHDLGGVVCHSCLKKSTFVAQPTSSYLSKHPHAAASSVELTPLVWKHLIAASTPGYPSISGATSTARQSLLAAQRLTQGYLEYKAGNRMKSLDLLKNLPTLTGKIPAQQLK